MNSFPTRNASDLHAAFFNRAISGFLLFDENLNLIDCNRRVSRILGIRKDQVIGIHLTNFSLNTDEQGLYERLLKVVRTGRSLTLKNIITNSSSGRLILDVHAFRAGKGLGIVMVDMTKVSGVIDEINLLLYKLSHDLRAPNSAIRGLVNTAKLEIENRKSYSDYLTLINKEALKLDAILKELSRNVEIKSGAIVISKISFEPLLKEVEKSLSHLSGANSMRIEKVIGSTQPFFCHRHALFIIFQNLLENAIKYRKETDAENKIFISVSDENKGVRIILKDNGIGIDKNTLPHVFEMFYRGTLQSKGSGLGLFTVKNSITALRGKIEIESELGIGTRFSIYLPSAIAPNTSETKKGLLESR